MDLFYKLEELYRNGAKTLNLIRDNYLLKTLYILRINQLRIFKNISMLSK
jgi:hypothetical protein